MRDTKNTDIRHYPTETERARLDRGRALHAQVICECGRPLPDGIQDDVPGRGDFRGARLAGHDFTRTDLRNADFTGADVTGAQFLGCDLRGAIFHNAKAFGARFGR